MELATDKRKEYADRLRALADIIENHDRQPTACKMFVWWDDMTTTSMGKAESYSAPMLMAGILLNAAIMETFESHKEALSLDKEPDDDQN